MIKNIIEKAYGSRIEELRDFIDFSTGWCSDRQYNQLDCPSPDSSIEYVSKWTREDNGERIVDVYNWIPKSIIGIEDNNGWITLKQEDGELDNINNMELYNINTDEYYVCSDPFEFIEKNKYTHYKPITKSKCPIY